MNKEEQILKTALEVLRNKTTFQPKVGIVLGTGLGDYANHIKIEKSVSYSELPDFPVSTVPGHCGKFIFGYVEDIPVVIMQGRVHFYEGYPMNLISRPIRLMYLMGITHLLLTNAAGGINPRLRPGSIMLISDHISSLVPSPLIGANLDTFGSRYPEMGEVYDVTWRKNLQKAAELNQITLPEGVYIQTSGPQFETPVEIRIFSQWGADAVGMSTVCEAIVARHCNLRVAGLSCISNMAAGLGDTRISSKEIDEVAAQTTPNFFKLITLAIKNCPGIKE